MTSSTELKACAECGRSYIHAMACSKYAGAAPLAPAAVDAVMAVDAERYTNEQYAHAADQSDVELAHYYAARPGPDGTTQLALQTVPGVISSNAVLSGAASDGHNPETTLADRSGDESALAPEQVCHENEVDDGDELSLGDEEDVYALSELSEESATAMACSKYAGAAPLAPADEIRDPSCTLCPLHGRARTVCVPGNGPHDAQIMLVSDKPSEGDDHSGVALTGVVGTALDTYLELAGLRRADVYVSNAVRCVTPSGRAPNKKEMTACMGYLVAEIAAYRPEVIMPLGATALQTVCGAGAKITKERGQQQSFSAEFAAALERAGVNLAEYGPFIIPTINPSAVASSPRGKAYEQDIIEDFKLVRSHATGVFAEVDVPWGYNDNLTPEAVKPRMGAVDVKGQVWAYDIETNAKPVYDPAFRISMLAIDSDGDGKVAVFRGASVLAGIEALRIAHDGGAVVLGHNASGFDRPGIEARTGINLRNSDDTMLMAHLLDEESGKKLEDLVVRRIKVRPWKDEVTWTWAAGPQTQDEWERAGLYNARDARYTRMLYQNLDAELRADPALHAYYTKLFLPLSRAMSKVERNGVYLSLDQVGRAAGEFTVQRMKAEVRVRAIVGNEKFNPGSSKQVREVLFDRMNLPVQEWTDGGETGDPKESTNELSLKRLKYLVEQNPELPAEVPALVNALLDYRNGVKMLGMLEADVENVVNSPDGRVHYWYSMIGSVSRSSSNGQQRPRDPRMRAVISAPPGRALVQGDFSQMEMRIAAHLSQDANLLELYRTGGDIHRFTAANITGKAPELVTKEERDDAKPWNFSLLYGAEEYTVESIMLKDFDKIYPRSEVTRRRDAYHDQFIGLQKTWYPAVWAEARNTGQVRTLTGRVRRLPDIYSTDDRKRLEAYRQAINFTDQALGYDIAGIALILAVGMGMQVSWFLHDGIYVECAVDEIEQVKANFASIEAETPRLLKELFGVELSVPLPIDVTVKLG